MKRPPSLSHPRQLRNRAGNIVAPGTRALMKYHLRLSGHLDTNTNSLGRKSLMDDFWLPKVSGALGTGKRGGKHPSQFQHVVSTNMRALYLFNVVPFFYCTTLYFTD